MARGRGELEESYLHSPIVDKGGYPYFVNAVSDGIPRVTAGILNEITDRFLEVYDFDCDLIMAPEAMGIHLATAVCLRTGVPFSVIRKRPYGLPGEIVLDKSTGYSKSTMYINGVEPGDRVVLLDDVISTGGTAKAIVRALKKAGAEVVCILAVYDKCRDISALEKDVGVPIRCILGIDVEDGKPVIR